MVTSFLVYIFIIPIPQIIKGIHEVINLIFTVRILTIKSTSIIELKRANPTRLINLLGVL